MKKSDFNYVLPKNLIAYYPKQHRSDSRLLVLNQGQVAHHQFTDILSHLQPNDLLVINDTKVMPARLFGVKTTGGKVEILIERVLDTQTAIAHVKASKSPKPGDQLLLENTLCFEVLEKSEGLFTLKSVDGRSIIDILENHGHIPLPPYIEREATEDDKARYQTVYAKHQGSVAAPTAGLHFDEDLLKKIEAKGVVIGQVTLHVGAGTFQPVRVDDIFEHKIHAEYVEVSEALCEQVRKTKAAGGRVVAVGTTSTRCLESAAKSGEIQAFSGDTHLFIYPGYQFQVVDMMITNFHLPESTLLMLISGFAGHAEVMQAYQKAVALEYRFYSYGDAMLIYKKEEIK